MKRSRFLQILGLGIVAAPIVIDPVITGLEAMISVKPIAKKTTDQLIIEAMEAAVRNADNGPQEFVLWTGKQGMIEFDKAMKEMTQFAMDKEYEMMYGKNSRKKKKYIKVATNDRQMRYGNNV